MKFTLTNVRGFEGTHAITIRPITILVGENSSGKTTLLAAMAATLNRDFPGAENLFNRAPFELGSFDTIATYRGGKYGRATTFGLGWSNDNQRNPKAIEATFKSREGVPIVDSIVLRQGSSELTGHITGEKFKYRLSYQPRGKRKGPTPKPKVVEFEGNQGTVAFRLQDVFRYFVEGVGSDRDFFRKDNEEKLEAFTALNELVMGRSTLSRPHATALAPLRTRPRRTYDELNDEFKPEGDHIPLVLARLAKQEGSTKELDALMEYGVASGLFEKIDVKRMGKRPSDPFQVRVKTKGPDANLIDVGYGVSQSLPIVIESLMARNEEVLLVQQPEVHLHPRAQAALGSFFVELASTTSKHFVIETHSDYLVDRVRLAIAQGKIPHTKVQLIYLERKGLDIKMHELGLDRVGNIVQAPSSYREFFLEEELKLMSRAS